MPARFLTDPMPHSRYRSYIALMFIVALFAAFPLTVAAQQLPHVIFTGKGFIDDRPVADGTVVEAWVRGIPVADTRVFDSEYQLYLAEPPGESFEGEVIRFKLGGYGTDAATGWFEGSESWILLYAYTGRQGYPDGFDGDVTVDPEPLDMDVMRELQARLLELEQERSNFAAELDHQVDIEIADVTIRWETAMEDLQAEVEREIQWVERKFELERRQIGPGPRREAILRELDVELDAFVREKWAEFEFELQLKQQFLHDDITEIEQARDHEINNLNQLIYQVESEMKRLLGKVGLSFDDFRNFGDFGNLREFPIPDGIKNPVDVFRTPKDPINEDPKNPVVVVAPHPNEEKGLPILEKPAPERSTPERPAPERPAPEESGRIRGFFTNSASADIDGLNLALDPTSLAVIGILITLAASGIQLVKGS